MNYEKITKTQARKMHAEGKVKSTRTRSGFLRMKFRKKWISRNSAMNITFTIATQKRVKGLRSIKRKVGSSRSKEPR